MSTITLRMPDQKHERLKQLAKSQKVSLNRLFDELSTIALTQFDAKVRFDKLSSKGSPKRGLELLDKLDQKLTSK